MRARYLLGVFALVCVAAYAEAAFRLQPPLIVLKADMRENMTWVDVVHTGGDAVAVELAVLNRVLDEEGEIVHAQMLRSEEFTVYPAQIILQPNERQRVQVVYNQRGRVTADKAFLLHAREVSLPVTEELEEVRTGIRSLVSYYATIALETGKPGRLTFVSSRALGDGNVEMIVENRSNGRVRMSDMIISVRGRDRITSFTGQKNSVMPGERRRITFAYPRPLAARDVSFGYR